MQGSRPGGTRRERGARPAPGAHGRVEAVGEQGPGRGAGSMANSELLLRKDFNNHHIRELFSRYPGNPILMGATWPYPANSVFNAGATQLASGETLLLV